MMGWFVLKMKGRSMMLSRLMTACRDRPSPMAPLLRMRKEYFGLEIPEGWFMPIRKRWMKCVIRQYIRLCLPMLWQMECPFMTILWSTIRIIWLSVLPTFRMDFLLLWCTNIDWMERIQNGNCLLHKVKFLIMDFLRENIPFVFVFRAMISRNRFWLWKFVLWFLGGHGERWLYCLF